LISLFVEAPWVRDKNNGPMPTASIATNNTANELRKISLIYLSNDTLNENKTIIIIIK